MFYRIFAVFFLLACSSCLLSQAKPTASRLADIQAGAGFVYDRGDYGPYMRGGAVYVDVDPTLHWGGEFEIHQAYTSDISTTYERSYEVGARYLRTYGKAVPYAKAMIGRGVFNFPGQYNSFTKSYGPSVANLAYNMYAFGVGSDFKIAPYLNLRVEYEYQSWLSFPPNGLNPQVITIGAAYHFDGGLKGGKRFR